MAAMSPDERTHAVIESVRLIVGMEIHVELGTRSKMFSRAGNVAHADFDTAKPNTLIDPVVLALPGALPVLNREAVDLAMLVGLAMGCEIPARTKWDRKSYFYPDLPKGYQISQYDAPLCVGGALEYPQTDAQGRIDADKPFKTARLVRAHLEEDAGKLMHESPGGGAIDGSNVDWNRAGTPLLEIVTEPDFGSAGDAVSFARTLRELCRFLGVTRGVMQKGHMRFEPNINLELEFAGGGTVRTPIVEIKNLNSFRALKGAIEFEARAQPDRWMENGVEFGPGTKSTRGWDDQRERTVPQREKEDAHDYRYFPDPDLLTVEIDDAWRESVRARIPELPLARIRRYGDEFSVGGRAASAIVSERADCEFFEDAVDAALGAGVARGKAGKGVANLALQIGARLANERGVLVSGLGISAGQVGAIVAMRDEGAIGSNSGDVLFEMLCAGGMTKVDPRELAERERMLVVRDDAALGAWCKQVIAANGEMVLQIRGGKQQAIGRLIGEVMKLSAGSADAKTVRKMLLGLIG